ncbi:Conidiation-specific protein 6 [Phaffia rhodozyma]|uniref:Conidiation-specific protein 6 n=1 Tax=Phaffia rhodozyma TaxID=264483 RepID=A0A0F7SWN7_PHARH|nr:Conidiation-specific protein 6 [Phaffia rhodozyma]
MSEAQVLGGYKATLSNPNTSDEAKEHAQQVLDGSAEPTSHSTGSSEEANQGNVLGGHKANLANPNTSEESKENSRKILEDARA